MKSEKDIERYIKVLKKTNRVEHINVVNSLEWVMGRREAPSEKELSILEETYKGVK